MFNIFGSDKKTSTTQTTTNYQHTDQSANAGGDSSIALGSGANLSIQTTATDLGAISGAFQTVSDTQAEETKRYMATVNALRDDRAVSARSEESTREAAQTAIETTTGLAQALSAQVADSKKDPNNQTLETVAKYVVYGVAALAAAIAIAALVRAKK